MQLLLIKKVKQRIFDTLISEKQNRIYCLITGIFISATLVQIFFWAILFGRFAFYAKKSKGISIADSPVSIIICARNEASNLRKNITYFLQQQYPLFELIVVDDDSADDTLQFLETVANSNSQLKIVEVKNKQHPGKKAALYAGIQSAKYEWLLLSDADCCPASTDWISTMMGSVQNGKVEIVLGYGPYKHQKGLLNKWIRFETLYTALQYMSAAYWGIPYMGVGRNLMYKKSVFQKHLKDWEKHQDLSSGDDDLFINAAANSKNTVFCTDPKSFVFSEPKDSVKALYRQKSRHFSAGSRYKLIHKILLGLLNASQLLFWFSFLLILPFYTLPALLLYALRIIIYFAVWYRMSEKFNEKDLKFITLAFDPFLFIYYIIFIPALSAKQRSWK